MTILMKYNESTAALRRVRFDIRGLDGLAVANGENGLQPEISVNDGAWTSTGIDTLTLIGNGRYYATLTQAIIATPGTYIQTRYKSASTIETVGDSVQVVGYNPYGEQGTGARTVTITVNDGATPLENATVRVTKGAETYVAETNASGQVVFYLDDGTWVAAISLIGYTFTAANLVVDGAETRTYSMTPLVITPSAVGLVTGYLVCYDKNGNTEAGVEIVVNTSEIGESDFQKAYSSDERTVVSDVNGLVQITNMFKGTTYFFRRGTLNRKKQYHATIPTDAVTPYALPSIIGSP